MKSLVQLTYGLESDFNRALAQILHRHQAAIERGNHELLFPPPKPITPKVSKSQKPTSTPDIAEAIEALESLANLDVAPTPTGDPRESSMAQLFNSQWTLSAQTPEAPSQAFTPTQGMDSGNKNSSQQSQGNGRLSYPSSQELHQENNRATSVDPFLLSQRIDRGDSVFIDEACGRENLEEYIDPVTLLPYENLDFGEDRCRVRFTVDTDPDETTRICGNLKSSCRRDAHAEIGANERAPPGYYKTV
eukprot:CAMPEP_0176031884 /NCGR_PEP_ID=MMETSP0120_2-20121206/15728_1 /TAXON_ID=160619 /ORGANISM="Kryptoperidinium foliaceum, Strain CCMP 1326" /LENGTH=246 /DNA_ID=CAMNT_0017365189 /DNA_START=129 /DNA_END=866 /DNA_ORIENTATION=+